MPPPPPTTTRTIILLLAIATLVVPGQSQPSTEFLWRKLVELPTATLQQGFMPSYVDFDRDILLNINVSFACRRDIRKSLEAFRNRQTWAFDMFNAWGKFPPSGVVSGTLTDYGDYDQCLALDPTRSQIDKAALERQYCLVDVSVPMPTQPKIHNLFSKAQILPTNISAEDVELHRRLSNTNNTTTIFGHFEEQSAVFFYANIRVGICLPASCLEEDIVPVAAKYSSNLGLQLKHAKCEKPTPWTPDFVQIVAM